MRISNITGKSNGHSLAVEFYQDEIDQLLSFVSAVRTFRPDWLDSRVSIKGIDPHTRKTLKYDNCVFVSAFSWGYLRTLIARNNDRTELTLGGGNAIVEDLAIESVIFRTHTGTHNWLTARRKVTDLISDVLANDFEERIWERELLPKDRKSGDGLLTPLAEVLNLLESTSGITAQHAACTIFPRLKSIPRLCNYNIRRIESFLEKPIDMALDGKEAFLQMHVCESIYWIDFNSLRRDLKRKIASMLVRGFRSADINVKLAAIISAARHDLFSDIEFGVALQELVTDVTSGNHPYLRYVRVTCEILMKRKDLFHLSKKRKRTIAELLQSLSTKTPNLTQWRRLLNKVNDARTNQEKKTSMESLAEAVFRSIPSVEFLGRDERTHMGEIDLRFRFRREGSSDFFDNAGDNVFLIECKHESSPMSAASISAFLQKLRNEKLKKGIIVSGKGITGKTGKDGYSVLQQAFQDNIKVVILTLQDLEEIVSGSSSVETMLDRKSIAAQSSKFE